MAKILVAMSGGVDSSVAAAMLQREGHEVVGCFMRLGSPGDTFDELEPFDTAGVVCDPEKIRIGHQGCCSINDAADAREVSAQLGVTFYVCNFKKDFGRIIDYFVDEYEQGRTPNPCVRCNDWLKFGKLHEYAKSIGAEAVASGHYARTELQPDGSTTLHRGLDRAKDQSYVLFGAPRDRLGEMRLPIGGLSKPKVRALAEEFGLPVFDKPDSQEICFVPDGDYAGLVERRRPGSLTPGPIVDESGTQLGVHEGHQHFTIGQRRGLGVALGHPVFVVDRIPATNTVVVGPRERLASRGLFATDTNWLIDLPPAGSSLRCQAKIRYNAEPVLAEVVRHEGDAFEVQFDAPQDAVAPGQACVLYDEAADQVLGGGWIDRARTE